MKFGSVLTFLAVATSAAAQQPADKAGASVSDWAKATAGLERRDGIVPVWLDAESATWVVPST